MGEGAESVKVRELKAWYQVLEDEGRRINDPDNFRDELIGHAKTLARLEIINMFELRELMEIAEAASRHAD